jgi:hypothetical protein
MRGKKNGDENSCRIHDQCFGRRLVRPPPRSRLQGLEAKQLHDKLANVAGA